jgi:hypothetical protein
MPIDHSALSEPVAIVRAAKDGNASEASVVTPPRWAHSVDIVAIDGAVLVATTGTEGSALTNYITVPKDAGYNLPLQTDAQNLAAATYLVQTGNTAHVIEYAYLPRGA